jgi:hypothetical protein
MTCIYAQRQRSENPHRRLQSAAMPSPSQQGSRLFNNDDMDTLMSVSAG